MAAMRATWTGTIQFGMVAIPVKLYKAVSSHDIGFSQAHAADMGKVKYVKTCADCGEALSPSDICRVHGDVVVTDNELDQLKDEQDKAIKVLGFVDPDEIHPLAGESSYWASPSSKVLTGYALFREALLSTNKVAVCEFMMRSKTYLARVSVVEDVLTVHTLAWPDEIRTPSFAELERPVTLKDAEMAVARQLVEAMSGTVKVSDLVDRHQQRVAELIAAKSAGEPAPTIQHAPEPQELDDIMSQLQASLAGQKKKGKAA